MNKLPLLALETHHTKSHFWIPSNNLTSDTLTMDARSIDNLETVDSSAETTDLIGRWRMIVKPDNYRKTEEGGSHNVKIKSTDWKWLVGLPIRCGINFVCPANVYEAKTFSSKFYPATVIIFRPILNEKRKNLTQCFSYKVSDVTNSYPNWRLWPT